MKKFLVICSIAFVFSINNICHGMDSSDDKSTNLECMDLLNDFLNSFKIYSTSSGGAPSDMSKTLVAKPSLLCEELKFSGSIDEHISQLRGDFYKVIHILLPSTNGFADILSDSIISIEQLRADFSKAPDKLEKLIFCKEANSGFHHNVCDNIDKILRNPVGRAIVKRILKASRSSDKKILFIPIQGFRKKDLTFEDPALMVITGEKYNIITVPIDTRIKCVIPGVNKKGLSPTMISELPFHSCLAHELIHCMHDLEDRELHQKLLRLSPSTCRVLEEKQPQKFCDFPTDEELYTVLGVHMTPNEGIDNLLGCGRKITSVAGDVTLKIDEISELTYDIFDTTIPILRILYYNEKTGSDLRRFVGLDALVEFLLQLFDKSTNLLIQEALKK